MIWLLLGIPALVLTISVIAATLGASRFEVPPVPARQRPVTELHPVSDSRTNPLYG